MRRLILGIVAPAVLLLAGCAAQTLPLQSNMTDVAPGSVADADTTVTAEYERRSVEASDILRAVCSAPANAVYFAKTACLPSGLTAAQLSSTARVTQDEKIAAARVFKHTGQLSSDMLEFMEKSGDPELMRRAAVSRKLTMPRIDKLQERFMRGELTWGQYNTERKAIYLQGLSNAEN